MCANNLQAVRSTWIESGADDIPVATRKTHRHASFLIASAGDRAREDQAPNRRGSPDARTLSCLGSTCITPKSSTSTPALSAWLYGHASLVLAPPKSKPRSLSEGPPSDTWMVCAALVHCGAAVGRLYFLECFEMSQTPNLSAVQLSVSENGPSSPHGQGLL